MTRRRLTLLSLAAIALPTSAFAAAGADVTTMCAAVCSALGLGCC